MEKFSLKSKVLKGFLWLATAEFLTQPISWLATIVIIRLLSPADYGLLAMSNTFVFIITTMSELGMNASLVQAKNLNDRDIRNIYGVVIVSVVICSLFSYMVAPAIASFYGEERVTAIIRAMIINFLLICFYLIPQSIVTREMDFKMKAKIDTAARVGSSLGTLVFAYFGMGVWSLVLGMILLHLIKLIGFNLFVAYPKIPLFNYEESKNFIFYGLTVSGDRLMYSFYNQIDKIIVGKILGDKLLGIYSVAINLASMPSNKILPIINHVSFTSYSKLQDNKERLGRNVLRATRVVAGVSFPVFFGMSAVAPDLIPLILGSQWASATLPFQLLCLIMPFKALNSIYPPAVFALGDAKVNLTNKLITCVVMSIAFIAGSQWGILGVCAAWITIFPLVLLFIVNRCLRVIGLPLRQILLEIWFPLIASTIMYGCIYFAHAGAGRLSALVALILSAVLGSVIYSLLVLLFYKDKYKEIIKFVR
jgi:O-antigen/teichoic acid export membrane protein